VEGEGEEGLTIQNNHFFIDVTGIIYPEYSALSSYQPPASRKERKEGGTYKLGTAIVANLIA